MEMRSGGLTHLTIALLKYRKRFEERFTGTLKEVRKQVGSLCKASNARTAL